MVSLSVVFLEELSYKFESSRHRCFPVKFPNFSEELF